MDLNQLIRRVNPDRLKSAGDGGFLVSCPCPDHGKGQGDRHQSLSINAGDAGGVVLYCHAGCRTEDVVAAFGLTMADLQASPAGPETSVRTKQPRKIAATYTYEDEGGRLLYQVIRYAPKDFKQRRPDGDCGWVWKLGDTRRVLYRLPEVIAAVAAGTPVMICEGEKDVEALRAGGAVATCNPHGAGKWKPEYSGFLRGADVTIIQDKDEPGRKHAAVVVASLAPMVASLRVVEAAVGKDAADHLAAGKTLDEFVHVDGSEVGVPAASDDASAAPRKAATASRRLKLVAMVEVASVPVEWLWEARLPRGKLAVVAGDPGLGKSYLTLKMAAIISNGGDWPDGSRATVANVLMVSAEDDAGDTIRPRLDRLGADASRITLIEGVLMDGAEPAEPFSLKMHVDLLREAIVEKDAALVIIDPLNAFLGGVDSHKAAEVRGVLSPLAYVAGTTHAAVLAVHHLNKGTSANALYRASGSLDFVAAARIVHGVAADPEVEGRRVFVPVKCNIAAMPEGLGFRIGDDGVTFDDLPVTLDAAAAFTTRSVDHEERSEREMAKDFLRDVLADGPVAVTAVNKAAKGNGFSERTVRRASGDLHVVKTPSGYQGAWRWSLPEGPSRAEDTAVPSPGLATSDNSETAQVADVATSGNRGHPHSGDQISPTRAHMVEEARDGHAAEAARLEGSRDGHGIGRDTCDDAPVAGGLAALGLDDPEAPLDSVLPWSADL
jgi:putative DNA primase/helicase